MAGLVHHPHQCRGEIRLIVARGDADIVVRPAAEGMGRDIEAPAREIESDGFHHLEPQRALRLDGKGTRQRRRWRPACLNGKCLVEKARQECREIIEQRVDGGRAPARLVIVQQGVVVGKAELLALGTGDLALKPQDFREIRQEARKIAFCARLPPAHLAGRNRLAGRGDKICRQGRLDRVDAADLAQVRAFPCAKVRLVLGGIQPIRDARLDHHAMPKHAQQRHAFGAGANSTLRHHGIAIPLQDADGVRERGGATEMGGEVTIGRHVIVPVLPVDDAHQIAAGIGPEEF